VGLRYIGLCLGSYAPPLGCPQSELGMLVDIVREAPIHQHLPRQPVSAFQIVGPPKQRELSGTAAAAARSGHDFGPVKDLSLNIFVDQALPIRNFFTAHSQRPLVICADVAAISIRTHKYEPCRHQKHVFF
jgi:hypothetical protein